MSGGYVRVVIVDDEPPARAKLRALLRRHPRFDVVGEAGNGLDAVQLVEAKTPDLVFLDVEMPGMNGFEVLEALEVQPMPVVVFVTAFETFAVKAFEVRALDYLLKPVDRERFEETLARVSETRRPPADVRGLVEDRGIERFLVRERGRMFLVPVRDVRFIEAAGNYVELHLASKTHLARGTLKEVERRLDPSRFARIHRSTIVNVEAIESIHHRSHGDLAVVLRDGRELRMSRRYRDRLPATLGG